MTKTMIRIGNVTIQPDQREVYVDDVRAELGSRAMELLLVLLEADGALVTKDALIERVWPTTIVTENSLYAHVLAIRKLLGAHRKCLVSVPGRGYRLRRTAEPSAQEEPPAPPVLPNAVLFPRPSLIGRDGALAEIGERLARHAIITLIGAGGIGKTSLALETGRMCCDDYEGNVWFVELGNQSDGAMVPSAVANAMGFSAPGGAGAAQAVISLIGDRPALLVLDNCEHLVDAVAEFVCLLAAMKPACKVLCTSREALRIPGEHLHHVEPLEVPAEDHANACILACSAVQLFLSRVKAYDTKFPTDPESLALVGLVCRRLDGIPLALELAAARAGILGIGVLAENIGERMQILSGGRRNALPRHQTLRATFDWSYNLLAALERKVLSRLGVLRGAFTLDEARTVAATDDVSGEQVTEALCALTTKSLIVANVGCRRVEFKLLETTRSYALQRLEDNGERDATELRRARALCRDFRSIRDNWANKPVEDSLADIRRRLDNVRAAVDWAFCTSGYAPMGCELSALFVPRLFDLGFVQECGDRARTALNVIEDGEPAQRETACLPLLSAYASSVVYTRGPTRETRSIWANVLSAAIEARESWFEARAIWGLWNARQYAGQPREALSYAIRFAELAQRDANEPHAILAKRITAIAEHYRGNHAKATELLEQMLLAYVHPVHRRDVVGVGIHHGIVARATVARILLVQGRVSEARRLATDTLAEARAFGQPMVTCYVLAECTLTVAALTHDHVELRASIEVLRELASRFGFAIWKAMAQCLSCVADLQDGCDPQRLSRYEESLFALRSLDYLAPFSMLQWMAAAALARAGNDTAALASLAAAFNHCDRGGEYWLYPELLRLKGEIRYRSDDPCSRAEGESCLLHAMTMARSQQATLLELRATMSLASVWMQSGCAQGLALLESVCARMPPERGGEDLAAAGKLIGLLRGLPEGRAPDRLAKASMRRPASRRSGRESEPAVTSAPDDTLELRP